MKLLTLNRDMRTQCRRRPFAVADGEGFGDLLMFVKRLSHSTSKPKLHPPVWLQPSVQVLRLLLKKRVPALTVNNVMKPFIVTVEAVSVFPLRSITALHICFLQIKDRLIFETQRGESATGRFKLPHHFEPLHNFERPELPHEDAATWKLLHKPRGRQALKRLAQWRARNPELQRKPDLVQSVSVGKGSVQYPLLKDFGYFVSASAIHRASYHDSSFSQSGSCCIQDRSLQSQYFEAGKRRVGGQSRPTQGPRAAA